MEILPFRRRLIDINAFLESLGLHQVNKNSLHVNSQNQSKDLDKEKKSTDKDDYLSIMLKEEMSNTISILDQFINN